jgi:hypothetical protein
MKVLLLLLSCLLFCFKSEGQILKKVGDKIQRDAEWRIRYKADQQINKGIESVMAIPQKIKNKMKKNVVQDKAGNEAGNSSSKTEAGNSSGKMSAAAGDENDMEPRDGYAMLGLSTRTVFSGGNILISGEGLRYKDYKGWKLRSPGRIICSTPRLSRWVTCPPKR